MHCEAEKPEMPKAKEKGKDTKAPEPQFIVGIGWCSFKLSNSMTLFANWSEFGQGFCKD